MRENLKFLDYWELPQLFGEVIYSSFFGGIIKLPWEPILDSGNFNLMLIVSIIFGAVHIFFGLGIKAYMLMNGDLLGAFYDVGLWYMALIGGAGFLVGSTSPELLSPNVNNVFKWVMIIGMVGIVIFGARDSKKPLQDLQEVLMNYMGISSYVGDFCILFKAYGVGDYLEDLLLLQSTMFGWSEQMVL